MGLSHVVLFFINLLDKRERALYRGFHLTTSTEQLANGGESDSFCLNSKMSINVKAATTTVMVTLVSRLVLPQPSQ